MLTFVPHKIKEDYRKVEFFRVNKELCNNEIYKDLSPTAILLYSLLCDRLSLTYTYELAKNISKGKKHYYDDEGNMFVIFTRIDLEEKLHVGKASISAAFRQLNEANLIKEKRQGNNKPNKIYVGKTILEIREEFINSKSENRTSGSPFISYPEVRKSDTNKNNRISTMNKYNTFHNYEGRDYSDMDWSKLYANNNWN